MKLPLLSGRQVLAALQRLGFVKIDRRIVFPYHREVDRDTLKGALRDADIEVEDFQRAVK